MIQNAVFDGAFVLKLSRITRPQKKFRDPGTSGSTRVFRGGGPRGIRIFPNNALLTASGFSPSRLRLAPLALFDRRGSWLREPSRNATPAREGQRARRPRLHGQRARGQRPPAAGGAAGLPARRLLGAPAARPDRRRRRDRRGLQRRGRAQRPHDQGVRAARRRRSASRARSTTAPSCRRRTGSWAASVDAVNTLIADMVHPTAEMARVIGAVAKGDLSPDHGPGERGAGRCAASSCASARS